jgi:hypothetical protein
LCLMDVQWLQMIFDGFPMILGDVRWVFNHFRCFSMDFQ